MLDVLHSYYHNWGLTVNYENTTVIMFNRSGRLLKDSNGFMYAKILLVLSSVLEYTYLEITLTRTGALNELEAAATRINNVVNFPFRE